MAEKEKVGTVNACPSCGAPVESFQTRCSSCGHELNKIQITESVQEFFQKLEELSNQEYRKESKESSLTSDVITFGKKLFNPYVIAMYSLGTIAMAFLMFIFLPDQPGLPDTGLSKAVFSISLIGMAVVFIIMKPKWTPEDKRRQSLIEMFPIPNSKEDLMEFLILATAYIKQINPVARALSLQAKRQLEWNKIWISKCKQVYTKARLAMKNDPDGLSAISQIMAEAGLNTEKAVN